ncbi:uncharacterized protein CcaverHIS019_0705980 [Cutaneotrichosporon cavernicola]|uniref:Zn(2)-C6 fungal-type domain-containing protein n=1 Tax=Cutaneotrichosporon cavernicola TaxID=279322 RepID=A0AA48LAP7_9TREE|nr:uncharacterized protein CcaverHIS019_0705980 [Cutaneotrichosporon cavernicola]BEI95017.1 hypothetical protein CcaverHIS019_0705980 [Cutaneotrichosporon cavernicola]
MEPSSMKRIERGKKACMPCRSRKCKCGGTPPAPCPNCLADGIDCAWPTEDGRSSAARKERARARRLASMAVRGLGRPPSKAERDAEGEAGTSTSTSVLGAETPAWMAGFADGFDMPFDPTQFILAMSSQLPTVECDVSPSAPLSPSDGKVVRITWWRPHGPTAIAPGLKRLSLKVRVAPSSPAHLPSPMGMGDIGVDGMPSPPLMAHLLQVFNEHFGCQFPALKQGPEGNVFLSNAIAATAARFTDHPAIAREGLKRSEYGNVFYARARAMLGDMLAVPSRETVLALVLMAHVGFGNDSESEEWMFTGMAVRMAIDLGQHLEPPHDPEREEEERLDRLTFWSVLLLDYALCFGTGRTTTFRPDEVTRRLPSLEDTGGGPFPHAARMMRAYGGLINLLNAPPHLRPDESEVAAARAAAVAEYNNLPPDMAWSATNLQLHTLAHTASAFLHIHLWMHTVLASAYLAPSAAPSRSGHATPVSALWRNSARTIGDALVLSDVIGPSYLALPFVNQAFYVAGCCYIKEIETAPQVVGEEGQAELFRSMLASVASTSITTLRAGLARQAEYWAGVGWVGGALAQRLEGIRADQVDLERVNEELETYVSVPEGVVRKPPAAVGEPMGGGVGEVAFGELDLLLPFDMGLPQPM